jgi:cysteine desulfurase
MNPSDFIYLDHSATTPLREEVLEAMLPYLREGYGNAGSIHGPGRAARRAVDDAREQVAALIHVDPREIVFTSGGTEADNLAIRGVQPGVAGRRIVTSAIEHHAILHACEYAERYDGAEVSVVNVGGDGAVCPDAVSEAIDDKTCVVSVMHANNETGAVQPIETIAETCAARGVPFHTDAAQSAGKLPIDVRETPITLLSLAAHKTYGPKGVGALYVRREQEIIAQAVGGAQERQRRAGTENVAGIVGFGEACELAMSEMDETNARMAALRDTLEGAILETVPGSFVNGPRDHRLPNVSNTGFKGVEGESVLLGLDMEGIAVSTGSACTAGSLDASHVLLAMGLNHPDAQSAVRFSLGRATTEAEITRVITVLKPLIERLRATEPLTPSQG